MTQIQQMPFALTCEGHFFVCFAIFFSGLLVNMCEMMGLILFYKIWIQSLFSKYNKNDYDHKVYIEIGGAELLSAGIHKVNLSLHSFEEGTEEDYLRYVGELAEFSQKAAE